MIPWTKADNKCLIEYVAQCNQNELPDRKIMQKLLRKCLEIMKNGTTIIDQNGQYYS